MVRAKSRLDVQPASIVSRTIAFLIDGLVLGVATAILVGIAMAVDPRLISLVGILSGFGGIFYFVYLEGVSGQTIGKRAMGIVVVSSNGSKTDMKSAAVRNILRIVDSLPGMYFVGLIFILISADGQRLGDMLGNTVVVNPSSARRR